jgi:hypothetical protein
MDILSALDEMKSLKARHERVDTEAALAALKRSANAEQLELEEEDEAAVRCVRSGVVRVGLWLRCRPCRIFCRMRV